MSQRKSSRQSSKAVQSKSARRAIWLGEGGTAFFIGLIALTAETTHLPFVLFPELAALSHDIFKRPHGAWARAPLKLIVTPAITGTIGVFIARYLDYGVVSVLLTIGSAIVVIGLLRSPIAPAISAGLLPLSLGISSWPYVPSLLIGLGSLAAISVVWRRLVPPPPGAGSPSDLADDIVEEAPRDYSWIPFFFAFLLVAIFLVKASGWRLILFPPLVVIAFEMFAHAGVCPWAGRPLILPLACVLSATAGVVLVALFGTAPLAAAGTVIFGAAVLRVFDLHVPPALAVGLLPFVLSKADYEFPVSVGVGTLLLTLSFMAWRRMAGTKIMTSPRR